VCCIGNPEVKKLPGRVGITGRIIFKYILKEINIMGRCDLDSSVSGPGAFLNMVMNLRFLKWREFLN